MANNEAAAFRVMRSLQSAMVDPENIDMQQYIQLWRHICTVIGHSGNVFYFVVQDVNYKLNRLEDMMRANPDAYKTMRSMSETELTNGTIRNRKPNRSGTGDLMVLNRAMQFVIELLRGVFNRSNRSSTTAIARVAYENHLARFHNFFVKSTVRAAFLTLPVKAEFVERLRGGEMTAEQEAEYHACFLRDGPELIRRVQKNTVDFDLTEYNPSD